MTTATADSAATAARPRRLALAGVALLLVAIGLAVAAYAPWLRGLALYHGHGLPAARIAGTGFDLPAAAARCANCHDARPTGASRGIAALDRRTLTEPRPRRGGPPSAYDAAQFCAALRDGIDPAYVMVDRTMPRFAIGDDACGALWTYVSAR